MSQKIASDDNHHDHMTVTVMIMRQKSSGTILRIATHCSIDHTLLSYRGESSQRAVVLIKMLKHFRESL